MTDNDTEKKPTPRRGRPIELEGQMHYLRYSLKTMRELREEFGPDAIEKGLDQNLIGKLIWYGLKHEESALTLDQVEEQVDLENLTDIMKVVAQATGSRARLELVPQVSDESVAEAVTEAAAGPQKPAPEPLPADAGAEQSESATT